MYTCFDFEIILSVEHFYKASVFKIILDTVS